MDQIVSEKIQELPTLEKTLEDVKKQHKTVVHCHGVFDLLHVGHIRHLYQAKKFGDVLVVTLTADPFVNKGPDRPAFTEKLRAEALAALECVDYVAINPAPSAVELIRRLRPNYYVKGNEYQNRGADVTGKITEEETAIVEVGGEIVFTDDLTFSSSHLLNRYMGRFPEDVEQYLTYFRKRYSEKQVLSVLSSLRELKVLVVGETIIDEYCYCQVIGTSGKEPVMVSRLFNSEVFAGGNVAIANHAAAFCDNVTLLSSLGSIDSHEDFVRGQLRKNVTPRYFIQNGRPTILKRRFVESYLLQKLFEVYVIDDTKISQKDEEQFLSMLREELPKYDVVICADYGHGMISKKAIDLLCSKSKFLCVNTQANAGNKGFHTISKYPRADYVSLSASEINLEMRRREGDPKELILNLAKRTDYGSITVTRGKSGIVNFSPKCGFTEAPALTQHVVDRVGSGDAVLSLMSLCAAQGVDPEIVCFLGNVAGSQAVNIVGHRSFLEAGSVAKHVQVLMK